VSGSTSEFVDNFVTVVTESGTDCVILINAEGICMMSSVACRGFNGESLNGKSFAGLVFPADREIVEGLIAEVLTSAEPRPASFRLAGSVPDAPPFEGRFLPFRGVGNESSGVLFIGKPESKNDDSEREHRLLAQAVESTRDAFFLVDAEGAILFVNPKAVELYALPPDAMVGRSFTELIARPEDREKFYHALNAALGGGWDGQQPHRRTDGGEFPVEVWMSPVLDDASRPVAVTIVTRDISLRLRYEHQLRTTAERLHLIFEHLSIVAFEIDRGGRFLLSRGKGLEKLGLKPDEVVGKSLYDVYRDFPAILEAARGAFEGRPQQFEGEVGGVVWLSHFIPIRDAAGSVVRVFGTAVDITAHKRAEEALRISETRYRSLFENSPISLWEEDFSDVKTAIDEIKSRGISDLDAYFDAHPDEIVRVMSKTKVISVNRTTVELYNAPDSTSFTDGFTIVFDEETIPSFLDSIRAIAAGKLRLKCETVNRKFTGEKMDLSLSWSVAPGYEETYGKVVVSLVDLTESRIAEEALRHESELLHTLMDNMPDTIYFKDRDLRFTRINSAHAAILGLDTPEEAIGKTDGDFLVPERALERAVDEQKIIVTGTPLLGKVERVTRRDGRLHQILTTKVPVRDSKGKIVGIVGSSRDITEFKQAEELEGALYRIAETSNTTTDIQSFYREIHHIISELMPVGNFYIAEYDSERDILSFPYFVDEVDLPPSPSSAGRGLTAYVLRTGKSLLCTDEKSQELERLGEAVLVGSPSPIWLGVPLISGNRPIGAIVVQHYSDPTVYTEREQHILEFVSTHIARAIDFKRSEEAIRQSEEKYRSLFEESQDAIILTSPDGMLMDINPAGLRLFGFTSRDELLPKYRAQDLYASPEDRDNFKQILARQGHVTDLEVTIRRQNGENRVVIESASVVRDSLGRTTGYRAYLRDITERKRLEDQLRQAQKMEGIGTLAGGIAHDFNNLLGIILGYASLLEGKTLDDDKKVQSVEIIKKAVRRGSDLVRQLLTFARKSDPTLEPVNLNETITDLVKMISETFPRTIQIRTQLEASLPAVIADQNQVHQALLNLCVNARDAIMDEAMPIPGTGSLTLSTAVLPGEYLRKKFTDAPAQEYVCISITDTGIGMDETTRARIFEPFYTTKGLGKGTGLGLAVVYGVVNSHHALVDVQSVKGAGSTFALFFPVTGEQRRTQATTVKPAGRGAVLIVEDEEMLLNLLQTVIEKEGFTVLTAADGQEGVDIFRERYKDIALVLSDMGLPRLGGWEMFLKMKEINPAVKAILASGYFNPNLKMDMLKAGALDFIQKPYVVDSIIARIRDAVEGTPAS
jgi:PAS domain S-box-containing protein